MLFWKNRRKSRVTILGLYEYDQSLFDGLILPEGMSKDSLVTLILKETANLGCMYPNFELMKNLIGNWSEVNFYNWQKLYNTQHFEYNPIWNKEGTTTETRTRENERTVDNVRTNNLTDSVNGSNENKIAGFNSSTYQPSDQSTDSSTSQSTGTVSDDGESTLSETETLTRRDVGNIGVTSTQRLIREEREISKFNLYDLIAAEFKITFCVLVY